MCLQFLLTIFCERPKACISFLPFHLIANHSNMFRSRLAQAVRQFSTTAVRREGHAYPGPGHNMPFDIYSKYKFTLYFALFFSSGFGLPFLGVRYVRKRSG